MTKFTYSRDGMGVEVQAPWGYYRPLEEGTLDYTGRRVVYTLGSACVEASCCGHGSWEYARVEGYLGAGADWQPGGAGTLELDSVDTGEEKAAIAALLTEQYPGVRVEFR
jgi:hypothetical protein